MKKTNSIKERRALSKVRNVILLVYTAPVSGYKKYKNNNNLLSGWAVKNR